ncbi:MAG: CHASE domain-containing protein [Rhodocyclaceae bacterium]|nr:CHASE domain-containing protein [Rhodocyclaceae bacterium]MBX3668355.1 CHASE domain-containing protein [Rhodocyclaceae bacterium]
MSLRPGRRLLAAFAAFGVGLLMAALVARQIERENIGRARERFERAAVALSDQLLERVRTYEFGVRGVRGAVLAAGPDRIGLQAFRRYVASRDVAQEFPGVRGFGFIRRVPEHGLDAYVAAQRRDGMPDFAPRELIHHVGEHYLIEFIEPAETNAAALGLDIASERRRREAADAAMGSGRATLTAPIELVQAAAAGRGFLLLLPVYENGVAPQDPAARRAATVGWAYAPLAMTEVLQSFDAHAREFTLAVYDVGADGAAVELIHGTPVNAMPPARGLTARFERSLFGRTWRIEIGARPAFVDALALPAAAGVFGAGLVPAFLLALFTYTLLGMREHARQLSAEQARLANLAGSSSDAIVMTDAGGHILDWNRAAARIFGYTKGEVRGRELVDLLVPPEHAEEEQAMLARSSAGQVTPAFDTQRKRSDGSLVEVSVAAFPVLGADGQVAGAGHIIRDISVRKDALRRLQELAATLERQVTERTAELERSRHDLRTVLDAIPAMVGYWDAALINRFANHAYASWFGVDPANLPGWHIRSLLGEDLYARNLPFIERALRGEAQTFERSIPVPGGQGVRHSLAYYLPDSLEGQVRGFYVLVHDVTELTENRLALARERERLDNILRGTGAGTWEWNITDGTLRFNERWAEMLGDAGAAWAEVGAEQLEQREHPEDRAHMLALLGEHLAGRSDFFAADCRLRHRDGHWVWMQLRGRVSSRDTSGRAVWVYGTSLDISAAKAGERRLAEYQNVLEQAERIARLGGWQLELDGSPLQLSAASCRIHGLPAGSQLSLQEAESYYAPEARAQFAQAVALAQSAGQNWDLELPFDTAAGQRIWVRTLGEAECEDGKPLRLFGTLQDISDRRAIEQALRDASVAAEAASAAKSEFLANVSHEIRTPLNAVLGMTHLLERSRLDATQQSYVAKVQLAGRTLLGIVNDVLDLSKIEAGEMRVEMAPVDVAALLRELSAVMLPEAQRKDLYFDVNIEPGVPARVYGDALRLRQILSNLAGNAIKFTERGGVRVSVSAAERSEASAQLVWSVRDTGIGISEAIQARLFTPFMQADASTTRRFGGTGLGLSIVRRLTALLGGNVSVTSAPGEGSEFRVSLPMQVPEDTPAAGPPGDGAPRVLIAAATDELRSTLTSMVRALGWRAQAEATAGALLAHLRACVAEQNLPDALLLDAGLGESEADTPLAVALAAVLGGRRLPLVPVLPADAAADVANLPGPAGAALEHPLSASALFNALNAALAENEAGRERLLAATELDGAAALWLSGVKVLVADDSDANLEVARRILEQQGASVLCCSNGIQVIDCLRSGATAVDAVLMDVQMPQMDGLETTRKLRAELALARLPVIALTAGALVAERQRCFDAGMNDFISKPLDPNRLIRVLRRHVEHARGQPVALATRTSEPAVHAADWPELEGMDGAAAKLRTGGDLALFGRVLRRLVEDYQDLGSQQSGLPDAAARAALALRLHKLQGTSATVGATRLVEIAERAEAAVRADGEAAAAALAGELAAMAPQFEQLRCALARLAPSGAPAAPPPLDALALRDLRKLLVAHDLAAIERFELLVPALGARGSAGQFERLRSAMENLEFDRAIGLLDALCPAQ